MTVRGFLAVVGWTVAALIVALAAAVSAFRIWIPHVPEQRVEVERWAARALGAPVEITAMDFRWRGLRPEIVLDGVRFVSADARQALAAAEVRIGVSLRSLARGRVAPARIVLVEPDLMLDFDAVGGDGGAGWRRTFEARDQRGEIHVIRGRASLSFDGGRRRVDLDDVNAALTSDGHNHTLQVVARPGGLHGSVRATLNGRSWPAQRDWRVNGAIAIRSLDLVAAQRFSRQGRLETGRADISIRVAVADGLQTAEADIGLSELRWTGGTRRVERAAAELELTRRGGDWSLVMKRLVAGRGDGVRDSGPLTVSASPTGGFEVTSARVHLSDLASLGDALPWTPVALRAWLERSPAGVVEHAYAAFPRGRPFDATAVELSASGLALDADPASGVPGFSGVTVAVSGDGNDGTATVRVEQGAFALPRLFRSTVPIAEGATTFAWMRDGADWTLSTESFHVASDALRATGRARYRWHPDRAHRYLAIDARFDADALAANTAYLPVAVMSDGLVRWLDAAVVDGRALDGVFSFDGVPQAVALRDGRATLEVGFVADDLTLAYADGWPALERGRARVRFSGTGFDAALVAGSIASVPVSDATVGIAAFSMPVLTVDAGASAGLSAMLDGFRETPVGRAAWIAGASADGDADLSLRLAIPLRGGRAEVRGAVDVKQALVRFAAFPHDFTAVSGRVSFTEDGASAEGLAGALYGRALSADIATLRDGQGAARAIEVRLRGTADARLIGALLDTDHLPVDGAAAWNATLFTPYDDQLAPYLELESRLAGLRIDLPAPLGKAAADSTPLTAHAELLGDRRRVRVEAGAIGRATGVVAADAAGRWRVVSGAARVGIGDLPEAPDAGVSVVGAFDALDIGATSDTGALDPEFPLRHVDLTIGALSAYGRELGAVALAGDRDRDAWRWRLDGERLAGAVHLPAQPTNDAPIRVVLERLSLPDAGGAGPRDVPLDATRVPPLSLHVGRLTVGTRQLGEVNATLHTVEHGVVVEGLSATQRDLRIAADASWLTIDGHHRTAVRGSAESTDVRRALTALGYGGAVDAAAGHLQFDFSWLGSPLDDPRPLIDGTLDVRVERGSLHEVQPGAGRVFGLLSLSALPRRLALDFSDVYRRGLAFDSITGSFRMAGGDAYTEDLRLQGPAARVEIKGRAGLATRDYDQEATVVVSLASSLAIAGTLAGGPGVGAAMLLASEILRGPLEGMARVRYRVTGSWEQPTVERVVETR